MRTPPETVHFYNTYYTVNPPYPGNPAFFDHLEPEGSTARRFSWLTVFCAILLIASAICVYQGAQGFVDPPATDYLEGELYVGIAGRHVLDPNFVDRDADMAVYVRILNRDLNLATYEVRFPAAFVARRFVLILWGSARLDEVTAEDDNAHTVSLKVGFKPCAPKVSCEVIYGTIPPKVPPFSSSEDCKNRNGDLTTGVTFSGYGHLLAPADWAHRIVHFPAMSGDNTSRAVNAEPLTFDVSVPLDGYFNFNSSYGCEQLEFNDTWKATDVTSGAHQSAYWTEWDSSYGLHSAGAVLQDRNAEAKGNALIATAAVVAAVAVGFLPIAYEAGRMWRRQRRRRA